MTNDIKPLLKRLEIEDTGRYDNHFYVIDLEDSNAYAKMYTKLDQNAVNTEFPTLEHNTSKVPTTMTHYFETEEDSTTYIMFLIGDFENDKYYLKIGEK